MANIFISFHPNDQRAAEQIAQELEQNRHSVWYNKDNDANANAINKQLKKATVFVYVLSPTSATFPASRLQLKESQGSGKQIIPVIMHPQTPVLPELQGVPVVNMMGGVSRSGLDQMLQMIGPARSGRQSRQAQGNAPQAVALPANAGRARSGPSVRTVVIELMLIVAVVLLVVAGSFLALSSDEDGPVLFGAADVDVTIPTIDVAAVPDETAVIDDPEATADPTEPVDEATEVAATEETVAPAETEAVVGVDETADVTVTDAVVVVAGETEAPVETQVAPTSTPTIAAVTPTATAPLDSTLDPVQANIASATILAQTAEAVRNGTFTVDDANGQGGAGSSTGGDTSATDSTEEVVETATSTPSPTVTRTPTVTLTPTIDATATPTVTPSPTATVPPADLAAQIRLSYSPEAFVVQNLTGATASWRGLTLQAANGDDQFLTTAFFPDDIAPNSCASIAVDDTITTPTGCVDNAITVAENTGDAGAVWVWDATAFSSTFSVLFNGYEIALCQVTVGVCEVELPYVAFGARLPQAGFIAYADEQTGNPEIWVMEGDGSNPIQITDDPATDRYPDFHPDGTRIMFASDRSGDFGIYTMNLDGSDVQVLYDLEGSNQFAARYSSDGTRIVFISDHTQNNDDIYVLDVGDDSPIRISLNTVGNYRPDWTPEGDFVVYSEERADGDLHASPAGGGAAIRFTSTEDEHLDPVVGPLRGGNRPLYFVSDRVNGVQVIWGGTITSTWQINTNTLQQLTNDAGLASEPDLSPDGRALAYTVTNNGAQSVFVVNIARETSTRIAGGTTNAYDPAWYPVRPSE